MGEVTISTEEYAILLKTSARVEILEDYLNKEKYTSTDTIKIILGIEEGDEK